MEFFLLGTQVHTKTQIIAKFRINYVLLNL
jgi:hypothetical protein